MRRSGLLLLTAQLACGSPTYPVAPGPATDTPISSPRLVLISIDGLRPDALSVTAAPNMRGIAGRGAYSWSARTTVPSNTLPSHVSMLSGYEPAVHRITWDDYLPQRGSITVATLFTATRNAGQRSVMIAGKEKFNHFRDTGRIDSYVLVTGGDDAVANEAIVQAGTGVDLMFVHFPNVDLMGHARGWMSASYLAQVSATDAAVGRLLGALSPQTTVILSADHGGHGLGHGTNDPLDMTIPWLIAGPRIAPGLLSVRLVTTDTAATAAFVLGISLPPNVSSRVVVEAFQPIVATRLNRAP